MEDLVALLGFISLALIYGLYVVFRILNVHKETILKLNEKVSKFMTDQDFFDCRLFEVTQTIEQLKNDIHERLNTLSKDINA